MSMEQQPVKPTPSLGKLISSLSRLGRRFASKTFHSYDFNSAMHLYLLVISLHPGSSQDFLVDYFYMDKGNVAKEARKLEERGYLRRELDPHNRRQYRLYLTPLGEEMVPIIRSQMLFWNNQLTQGFSKEEKEQLISFLLRMEENGKQYFLEEGQHSISHCPHAESQGKRQERALPEK